MREPLPAQQANRQIGKSANTYTVEHDVILDRVAYLDGEKNGVSDGDLEKYYPLEARRSQFNYTGAFTLRPKAGYEDRPNFHITNLNVPADVANLSRRRKQLLGAQHRVLIDFDAPDSKILQDMAVFIKEYRKHHSLEKRVIDKD